MKERQERDEARQLYREGWSYNRLAEHFSASKSTISKWCRDLRVIPEKVVEPAREKPRKSSLGPKPYSEYWVYHSVGRDGIGRVQLVHSVTGLRRGLSRARYEMACHLGREITADEVVIHREGSSDEIDNLKLVAKGERRRDPVKKECVICEQEFEPKKKSVETCSKACKYILISGLLSDRA